MARIIFSFVICCTGLQIVQSGAETYSPLLRAWRRMIIPDSKNKINDSLTWEFVNLKIIEVMGSLMIVGGLLIMVNLRKAGTIAVMAVLSFLLITQDNPLIENFIKPQPKKNYTRMYDITRHLSLMGVCLFLMLFSPE